jgi:hypothetical protein
MSEVCFGLSITNQVLLRLGIRVPGGERECVRVVDTERSAYKCPLLLRCSSGVDLICTSRDDRPDPVGFCGNSAVAVREASWNNARNVPNLAGKP